MNDLLNITFEVDPVRAHHAYVKGMEEFAELWPVIKAFDAEQFAKAKAREDGNYFSLQNNFMQNYQTLEVLVKMRHITIGPYRMTASQANWMLGWESGRTIESIKAQIVQAEEWIK